LKDNRITLVMLWVKSSGNVTSVNDLVLRLDKKRFKVIFIFLTGSPADKNPLKEKGYEVFYLKESGRLEGFSFTILSGLIKTLKKCNPDIIHCHGHKATVYGSLASNVVKIPVVMAHVHGLDRSRSLRRKITNLFVLRKVSRILCVADSVRTDVLKNNWLLSPEKVSVLANSVDYERFANVPVAKSLARQMLGLPVDAFVCGTVGRLVPTKGLSYLIDAFAKFKKGHQPAHLVLLGTGQCKEELQQQAMELSCSDSVHFLGHKSNIEQLLKGFDVFVMSSVAEGMPRVLLEAMAAGVPCIATAVGGNPEIINTADLGFLVKPKDPDALAGAMNNAANISKEKLAILVEKAKERIRTVFSHEMVAKKLMNIYEEQMCCYYESQKKQTNV
jgi:glycosyltransferase involved in cell wall biosynthesis